MKNTILLAALMMSAMGLKSQEIPSQDEVKVEEESKKSNYIKLNLLTPIGGKYSLEYERILSKRLSLGVAFNYRPEAELPFKSKIMEAVDEDEINSLLDGMRTSSTSVIPEIKFYLSKSGFGKGFYLAPYTKFSKLNYSSSYKFDVEIDYEGVSIYDREEIIPLSGEMTTLTAGLSLGVNFKLAKNIFLDWRIIGPGYGTSKGDLSGEMALNADEQQGLDSQLADLKENVNELPGNFSLDYNVNANGANITLNKSPWASLRSGFSIAFKF